MNRKMDSAKETFANIESRELETRRASVAGRSIKAYDLLTLGVQTYYLGDAMSESQRFERRQ